MRVCQEVKALGRVQRRTQTAKKHGEEEYGAGSGDQQSLRPGRRTAGICGW